MQALILLGIYAMFDPSGISLWHVVGFAARTAIALNLHRRVDDTTLPRRVVEQRKRVFYGLFNLDRLVAVTLSKPLAISDDDIDVEVGAVIDSSSQQFPSELPTDSPYRGTSRISFIRHIIKLRRLLGRILTTVYSVSGSQNSLPEPQRAAMILDLHTQLDEWLAESPMPPSDLEVEEKRGMINNHSWFLLNYHQGLCFLYRPSPLYPTTTPDRLRALHEASTRSVDLYLELWHEGKVSYNLINVSLQFLACISLLYCLCEYDNRSPGAVGDLNWRREVSSRVGQCQELLEAFSRALPETAKYREIFSRLSDLLLARHGPIIPEEDQAALAPSLDFTLPTPQPDPRPLDPLSSLDLAQGETAWSAMTQLWHDSGDFNFDEAALNSIYDDRLAEPSVGGERRGEGGRGRGRVDVGRDWRGGRGAVESVVVASCERGAMGDGRG